MEISVCGVRHTDGGATRALIVARAHSALHAHVARMTCLSQCLQHDPDFDTRVPTVSRPTEVIANIYLFICMFTYFLRSIVFTRYAGPPLTRVGGSLAARLAGDVAGLEVSK